MRSRRLRSNLCWATKNEQANNQYKPTNKKGCLIQGIDIKSGEIQYKFSSIQNASNSISSHFETTVRSFKKIISKCLNGKIFSYKRIQWQYTTLDVLPGEIWAEISEINNLDGCMISSLGRFYNKHNRITCGRKNDDGYMAIIIKGKGYLIHRLLALYFIYNDDEINKTVVNHINEDKTDNRIENLQWCTLQENSQHSATYKKVKIIYKNKSYYFEIAEDVANS